MKYLTLIRTIALLHQYQRPIKKVEHNGNVVSYIDVTPDDIKTANKLAHEVLGRSLDELPPQTRRLLVLIDEMVTKMCHERQVNRSQCWFTRREVREYAGWGNTQLKHHLNRLEELEYLLTHRSGRGLSFVYELLYHGEGKSGESFLMGLFDIKTTKKCKYDAKWSGVNGNWSGGGRPLVGPKSGGGRVEKIAANPDQSTVCLKSDQKTSKMHIWLQNPDFASNPYIIHPDLNSFNPLVASAQEAGRVH